MTAAAPPRVGVFLAGVQKGGTTALYEHLAEHPSLAGPRVKETHHFDNESLDWTQDQSDALDAYYDATAEGRMRFDATPITLYWPPALPRLHAYNPAAKLIVLFRDPIERAYSHWRMEVARGTEPLSFADAIRSGRERLHPDRPLDAHWRDHSYVERGCYGAQLTRALSLFPRSQMLLLLSEDFHGDHRRVLEEIAAFLGISAFGDVPPRIANQAVSVPYLPPISSADRNLLRAIFAADMAVFAKLSGLDIGRWSVSQAPGEGRGSADCHGF